MQRRFRRVARPPCAPAQTRGRSRLPLLLLRHRPHPSPAPRQLRQSRRRQLPLSNRAQSTSAQFARRAGRTSLRAAPACNQELAMHCYASNATRQRCRKPVVLRLPLSAERALPQAPTRKRRRPRRHPNLFRCATWGRAKSWACCAPALPTRAACAGTPHQAAVVSSGVLRVMRHSSARNVAPRSCKTEVVSSNQAMLPSVHVAPA